MPSSGSISELYSTAITNTGASARSAPSAAIVSAYARSMSDRRDWAFWMQMTRPISTPFMTNVAMPATRIPTA